MARTKRSSQHSPHTEPDANTTKLQKEVDELKLLLKKAQQEASKKSSENKGLQKAQDALEAKVDGLQKKLDKARDKVYFGFACGCLRR